MNVVNTSLRTRRWPIGGMVSAGCARIVEKAVTAVPGVTAASANFATASLQVSFDPARLSTRAVAAAVRRCGFECDAAARESEPAKTSHAHRHHVHPAGETPPPSPAEQHAEHAIVGAQTGAHDAHAGMHHGGDLLPDRRWRALPVHAVARDCRALHVGQLSDGRPQRADVAAGTAGPTHRNSILSSSLEAAA
jgi:copper chaperone CopZ